MSIGDRVRAARKSKGLTQQKLASKAGIRQSTLSELENGESVSTSHIASIAAALGVSALWLQTGRGPRTGSADNVGASDVDQILELVAHFRDSTPEGREFILDSARSAEKVPRTTVHHSADHKP